MTYFYFFIRFFCFYLILLVSGCSTYHQTSSQYNEKLNRLFPHYVAIPEGRIEYYRTGHGSPVILIPGYATDVSSWNRKFLATLAAHHQIFIPNNRQVGGTDISSDSYTSKNLANDTYQFIRELKLNKPTVIGISMGGMVAQQLVVLHPDSVGHLVLINTIIAGKKSVRPSPVVQAKLANLPKNKLGFYFTTVNLFFPPSWRMKMSYSLTVNRFRPENLRRINAKTVIPKQQLFIKDWLLDNTTAKKIHYLSIPVLILSGESDIIIPPSNSEILATTIPHARLIRWKEGGHAMLYQYPEEMGNDINDFIAK